MSTTKELSISVATIDLRRAFKAVKPHAERNKTGDNGVEHRVRLSIDASEMYVLATNGQTTGCAAVPLQDDSREVRFSPDDGPFLVDLQPKQVALILQHFPVSTGSGSELDEMIQLRATTDSITLEDVGGLFAGDEVTFTTLDLDTSYPDIPNVLAQTLALRGSSASNGKPLVANGKLIALFAGAASAYDQPVEVYPTGTESARGFVVAVGHQFVGTIESRHQDDDGMRRRDSAYRRWLERFPASRRLEAI